MKVEHTPSLYFKVIPQNREQNSVSNLIRTNDTVQMKLSGPEIPFGAIHGIKPLKNVLDKKIQILQKIESMLAEKQKSSHEVVFREVRDRHDKDFRRLLSTLIKKDYTKSEFIQEIEQYISPTSDIKDFTVEFLFRHVDEFGAKIKLLGEEVEKEIQKRKLADTADYSLLGKLHSTLIRDNLDLTSAYREYYSRLTSMTKLSEVHKAYPKLNLPPSPVYTAGKKIVNIFPKDLFVKYDELVTSGAKNEASELLEAAFDGILKEISKDSKVDLSFLRQKLFKGTRKAFLTTYHNIKKTHGFASYPEQKKIKRPILNQSDLDLLSIDYDRFVIHVLKEQYLSGKKLSEIRYVEGSRTINPNSLSPEYKFEKPDEKIKNLLKLSEALRKEETNYDKFTDEQFRARIKHFSNHEMANSEILLERLIDFDAAHLVEGDRQPLIRFLRVLDDLCDNKISIEQAEEIVQKENLRPLGTDLINAAEKEKNLQLLKEEQKRLNEFNKYCRKYDNAIESLFRENLEEAATLCISYKPKSLEDSREISDNIIKLITESMEDGKIIEPEKLDKSIKNMNEFYHYKTYYPNNPLLEKAIKFGTMPDGSINTSKAGQYLSCSELVEKYPTSSGYFSATDNNVFTVIMQKSSDRDEAVKNLIKFDDYNMLSEKEKLKISTILNHFDINSDSEKAIIESIIDNIYVNNPTYIKTSLNKENSIFVDSVMSATAKKAIIEDKPFPACLKYFEAFEKSLSRVGQSKEEDGIQVIGSNNKTLRKLYKQEVKIPMDERLYSSQGNYVFDIYKPGLHKAKYTKA